MKKLILLFNILFLYFYSFGQSTSEVVSVDSSFTKEILYSNALSFFANTFNSANNVIQMKDPETGKIIGRGLLGKDKRDVTITISCKDTKYKYEIDCDYKVDETFIEFGNITKCGVLKGQTFLKIKFIGNEPIIDIENVFFINKFNGQSWIVHYSGENNILGLSRAAIENWKVSVDESFNSNELEFYKVKPKTDYDLLSLIDKLKKDMSKPEW
jgi:hypothetical protein